MKISHSVYGGFGDDESAGQFDPECVAGSDAAKRRAPGAGEATLNRFLSGQEVPNIKRLQNSKMMSHASRPLAVGVSRNAVAGRATGRGFSLGIGCMNMPSRQNEESTLVE